MKTMFPRVRLSAVTSLLLVAMANSALASDAPATHYDSALESARGLNQQADPLVGEISGSSVSLVTAFERALELHPSSQLADTLDQSAGLQRDAASLWLGGTPTVATRYNSDSVADDIGEEEWEVVLNLPLTPMGEHSARQVLADQQQLAAGIARSRYKWLVAGELRERLWEAHAAALDLQIAEEGFAKASEQFAQLERLVRAGSNPRADLLLAEAVKLEAENAVIDARAELSHTQRRWQLLTGSNALPKATAETLVAGDHEELLGTHPMARWLDAEVDVARASEKLQRETWTTKPVFGLGYRGQRPNNLEPEINAIGVFFEIPLDFGGFNRSAEAAATQQRGLAEWESATQHRNLEVSLLDAELTIESEQRALTVSNARAHAATEAERLAVLAFENGEITFLELLQTRERAFSARAEKSRRALAVARSAARFNQAAGVLPQ